MFELMIVVGVSIVGFVGVMAAFVTQLIEPELSAEDFDPRLK